MDPNVSTAALAAKSPSIGQRILADTPPTMKKIAIAGFVLVLAAAVMFYFKLPAAACGLVFVIGSTATVVANIAVKDVQIIESAPSPLEGITEVITDLPAQIAEIKAALANHSIPAISEAVANVVQQSLASAAGPTAAAPPAPAASTKDAVIDDLNAKAAQPAQTPPADQAQQQQEQAAAGSADATTLHVVE